MSIRLLDSEHVPIAAICAATTVLARLNILHGRRHTSNGLEFLRKAVPTYSEGKNYVDEPAVRDRGVITASGLGDVEFAEKIFDELDVMSAEDRVLWARMFRSGKWPKGLS